MDASDLARWTRFAAKGGIGKCTALQDCVAQGVEDLMFLKDDEVVVLLQLPQEDQYLGYCEGVVGRFHGSAVHFHGKLKKPVFAKRQSTPGTSPSRPVSFSPHTPSPGSSPVVALGSKHVTSPATSPLGHSLPVPSPSDGRATTRVAASAHLSSTSTTRPCLTQSHARTPSSASSTSHYSTHSQSHGPTPSVPSHLQTHTRKPSTASSHSTYSSGSRPPSRPPSRTESIVGSGSEDTHTQHVSLPPPLPITQATPALTDGSSAHSSFLLSPTPAFPLSFTQQPHSMAKVPASMFQGRNRSASEKQLLPREDTPEGRRRNGSESLLSTFDRLLDDKWDNRRKDDQGKDQVFIVPAPSQDMPTTGLSETSFRSLSVYSTASGGEQDVDERRSNKDAEQSNSRGSVGVVGRGILNEDDSDEEIRRRVLSSSPDDLSDGGFGIGMTLLREDDDAFSDGDDYDGSNANQDRGPEDDDDNTAVGHIDSASPSPNLSHDIEIERVQMMRRLKTLPMRVVNRGSVSTRASISESEMGEDDTVVPTPVRTRVIPPPSFRGGSEVEGSDVIPARQPSHTHAHGHSTIIPPRPPFATRTSTGSRASSRGPTTTEDEHWESDADIYDDYRYSRYSTRFSGSASSAQHSSRRASRGSAKSGRSRGSGRPPLPEEEGWRRTLAGASAGASSSVGGESEEGMVRESVGSASERSEEVVEKAGVNRKSVLSSASTVSTTVKVKSRSSDIPALAKSRTPSPTPMAELSGSIPTTPGMASFGMVSLTSPLTRAFRKSDDSKYSRASGGMDDEMDEDEDADAAVDEDQAGTDRSDGAHGYVTSSDPEGPGQRSRPVTRHLTSPDPDGSSQRSGSRSPAPALASSIRETIENERRAKSASPNSEAISRYGRSVPAHAGLHLSVVTTPAVDNGEHQNVIILNDSPGNDDDNDGSADAHGDSVSNADGTRLRVETPQSYQGSAPPSPLNPGFPPSPSPSSVAFGFASTPPLSITKGAVTSSSPRQPVSPPAIPFAGVPPPGRPPVHMQQSAQYPYAPIYSLQQQQQRSGPGIASSDSLYSTLRLAGQQRANTIHGRTQADLLTATGPVPISFLLPGMLPSPPPAARPQPATPPAPYGQIMPPTPVPAQSQTVSSPQAQGQQDQYSDPGFERERDSATSSTQTTMRRPVTVPAPPPGMTSSILGSVNLPSTGSPPVTAGTSRTPSTQSQGMPQQSSAKSSMAMTAPPPPASPLPRANFFPKVGQARPRSRSFSGFHSDITEKVSQTLQKRSQEEGSRPFHSSTNTPMSISPSLKISSPLQPPTSSLHSPPGKAGQVSRPTHVPSPLSLPPTTNESQTTPRLPLAPHALVSANLPTRATTVSAVNRTPSSDAEAQQPKRGNLWKASSHLSLRSTSQAQASSSTAAAATSASPSILFPPQRRNSGVSAKSGHVLDEDQVPRKPPSPPRSSMARKSHESDRTHASLNQSDVTSPPTPYASSSPSSSPMTRSGSLRSKMSMSALKSKGTSRGVRDGGPETPMSTTSPSTPAADEDTVQIKDMEFELIRPAIPIVSSDHRGDEGVDSKIVSIRTADLRRDSSSVRSEVLSPGGLSPSDHRFVGSLNSSGDSFSRKNKGAETSTSVQAHRDRELKWISTMNSSDPAQAKRSKKIKKLLIDGVPSSVRYLVWAHISNSGSKKMPNVYTQLSKRSPVMAQDIERDVEVSFPDHPHLRDPNGPLVAVLFAYIAMVPDLRYHRGLAIIAGHLLLQSPEEDAFWTFLAMMDSYLRPYFMPASPQMGIDANLFVKAVESMDSLLATQVFAKLNVRANELCGVWFSSVFAGTLPLEHLHRVWDLFLYEGVPLLFRVGLTILFICRRYLLEAPQNPSISYMAYLLHPPPEALPADPEQFIAQVLSVKLKDDDIRKSRVKMEAAVKQQRPPRNSTLQPSHPHLQQQPQIGRARVS